MPIAIEPTDWLNRQIDQLPTDTAARLWRDLDAANKRICAIAERLVRQCTITTDTRAVELIDAVARAWGYTDFSALPQTQVGRKGPLQASQCRAQAAMLLLHVGYTRYRVPLIIGLHRTTIKHYERHHEVRLKTDTHYRTHWQALTRQLDAPTFPTPTR